MWEQRTIFQTLFNSTSEKNKVTYTRLLVTNVAEFLNIPSIFLSGK